MPGSHPLILTGKYIFSAAQKFLYSLKHQRWAYLESTRFAALDSRIPDITEDLRNKLLLLAGVLYRKYMHGIPSAFEPEDLFQEAYRQFLDGTRKYPEGVPVAIAFYNAMKSIIHNFRRKNDYHAPLPEEVPERKLLITDFDKDVLRKRLCRMAKGNENLIKVIMYIIDDPDVKPGELALELDESPAAIYKKKRELRRLSSKLREKDTH